MNFNCPICGQRVDAFTETSLHGKLHVEDIYDSKTNKLIDRVMFHVACIERKSK